MMKKGIVFDIQKFSLHDGPGIRTTVFLKGCPLSCRWCANPESWQLEPQLGFIEKNCRHCLSCVDVCPESAHQKNNGRHSMQHDRCIGCGRCVKVCPHNALKMYGYIKTVDEVMNTVRKDMAYYAKSGGGITLSGGEPILQFEFAHAILTASKACGISTCIETSGYVETQKLAALLPVVDIFLFDYKIYDDDLMKQHVGVSNELILKNLAMLDKNNANIYLRCPIIPGINDNDTHFSNIIDLANSHQNIKSVQLLPYHDYGRPKDAHIGRLNNLNNASVKDEMTHSWLQKLSAFGCSKVELA